MPSSAEVSAIGRSFVSSPKGISISAAFAKGMTFEELSQLTGEPLREVQFELDAEDVAIVRSIPGFKDFDPVSEVLAMTKAIYGLKDAPRAWRKKLLTRLTRSRIA